MRYAITLAAIFIGAALTGCEPADLQSASSETACDKDYAAIKAPK